MLRKIMAVVCLFTFLIGFAFAEGIDFSGLSDSELLDIFNGAKNEIDLRNLNLELNISSGIYIIGREISAGGYVLSLYGEKASDRCRIDLVGPDGDDIYYGTVYASGNVYLYFEEGQKLELDIRSRSGTAYLTIRKGLDVSF